MFVEGILALTIPIVAIIVWSPVGKAIAERLRTQDSPDGLLLLESRLQGLEERVLSQESELNQLRTSVEFYDKLLPAQDEDVLALIQQKKKGL